MRATNGYSQINRERIRMCNCVVVDTRRAEVIKIDPAINPRTPPIPRLKPDLIAFSTDSTAFQQTFSSSTEPPNPLLSFTFILSSLAVENNRRAIRGPVSLRTRFRSLISNPSNDPSLQFDLLCLLEEKRLFLKILYIFQLLYIYIYFI